jgi:hypothetical protein
MGYSRCFFFELKYALTTAFYFAMFVSMNAESNRVGGIRNLWKAHATVRSGEVSELLGSATSKAVAETASELGRREGQIELRPTSSPARSLDCKLPSVP